MNQANHPNEQLAIAYFGAELRCEILGRSEPLQVQLIEMRYFAGMTAEECSTVLAMPVTSN